MGRHLLNTQACLRLDGEEKLPPRGSLAPQTSSRREHGLGKQVEFSLPGGTPQPHVSGGEWFLGVTCLYPSSCPSYEAYKRKIRRYIFNLFIFILSAKFI